MINFPNMKTVRKSVSKALIDYLDCQYTNRDGVEHKLIPSFFGIFGHGNVAGIGQALLETETMPYVSFRNEQAMVHAAVAYAKVKNRLSTMACTSSIGPGATNMVTGAALATINRLPVLLLPGDIFATRHTAPVLQQLESSHSQDVSVNDVFRPVSKYWDRINRPEQLITALPQAMQILTSSTETGAVTLCMPQDVQADAYNFPAGMFHKRIWTIERPLADRTMLKSAVSWIRHSSRPLIIAGGGVKYSEASDVLQALVNDTGIPVCETMAGKGSLHHKNPHSLGAVGVTGTPAAVEMASAADLVIGIGTRYSDFTTSSRTLFKSSGVRFININICPADSVKMGGLPLRADARETLRELHDALRGWKVASSYRTEYLDVNDRWKSRVAAYFTEEDHPMTQAALIGAVSRASEEEDIIVNASGSLPGDLHKLWQATHPKNFHLEYGYSCMGYEIAGGLGAKMAAPNREVIVMVGDGSYLMMAQELITSIQEDKKIVVVLVNNHGFKSIGSLSRSLGGGGFGTRLLRSSSNPDPDDLVNDEHLERRLLHIDYVQNAASLGAEVLTALTPQELEEALKIARANKVTTLIYTECDRYSEVEGYSWWEVPVSRQSASLDVQEALARSLKNKQAHRYYEHPDNPRE